MREVVKKKEKKRKRNRGPQGEKAAKKKEKRIVKLKTESGEQTEGRQTSTVRQNLCQWVSMSSVGCRGRLLRLR